jgi:transcriptional regulator with XRE-family HTH domain
VANEEALFRRRLRELVIEKYGSLDRFYLETDFSKGHLSQILRGKRSPSLATIVKLAKALQVEVADFFTTAGKKAPAPRQR